MPYLSNRFLASLSIECRSALMVHAIPILLPARMVLVEAEEVPRFCYFMREGMISIVTNMDDGLAPEVGVIGNEGVVGALQLLGPGVTTTRAFVQVEGTALRIPLARLQNAFDESPEIRARILEFVQEQSICMAQISGCNRLHEAEERLARWLLMAQDRTQCDRLQITQEFLAIMLGARRTTVTQIAGILQSAGLIRYTRGRIEILNRPMLQSAACDCYQVTKGLLDNLYTRPWSSPLPGNRPPASPRVSTGALHA